ncbi:MAG: tetratricopeptide repeat protein [Acidobacteriota bacterium]|nr:tetratricopeptide repeat protein [Acidobacteriota bacterium]
MAQPANNPKIEELRFRVKTDPKSRLFFPLAEELRKSDQFTEAEQVLRAGLTHHPAYLSAWVSLGRVLRDADKPHDAVEALNRALVVDPGNVVAARLLADSYLDLGDKLEAIKKYKLVRALMPAGDEELDAVIERLDRDLNPPHVAPFMTESEAPAPADEAPFAATDSKAFADAEAAADEDQTLGVKTADIEPMRVAHAESPFEEPVTDYTAAAVQIEQPKGVHIEAAPAEADVTAPWTEEEPASDVFAPAEAPLPASSAVEDATKTITMADLYVQQGFADQAREIYQTILQREPGNADVRRKLDALMGPEQRNPKAAKLEAWLKKVKKREEGSVV